MTISAHRPMSDPPPTPPPRAPAVHLGDHGLGAPPQAHEFRNGSREGACRPKHVLSGIPAAFGVQEVLEVAKIAREVEPRTKSPARPAKNDDSHLRIAVRLDDGLLQLLWHV